MESYESDKLVMLLSTDWFLPHWPLIGLLTGEAKKPLLQQGCREIVRQLTSGAKQYWDIEFSSDRVRKTRKALDSLMKKYKLEEAAVDRINRLVSGEESPIDDGTRWLLVSLTEQLLDGSATQGPQLDNAITGALGKEWTHPEENNFKELCLTSTSNWDQYLRSLTPDLPAMLADYVSAIASQGKFEMLWGFINTKLTTKQRHELFSWYRAVGESLSGEPLRLPHEV